MKPNHVSIRHHVSICGINSEGMRVRLELVSGTRREAPTSFKES